MKRNIPVSMPVLKGNERKYVNECLESTWISSKGRFIEKFEEEFASFCNRKYAMSCCNGTIALHLVLMALGTGKDDEVLVPTLTYVAVANAVTYCGAKPVLVDSEADTWNIDPNLIEGKITNKTRGIIVVHLYGHPVDMEPIMKIAEKNNIFVIEDAAEAHGAIYKNRIVGSIGNCAAFSFFGNKIITTGEGGMVVTDDEDIAKKVRLFKGQGMDESRRYWFPVIGYNYRMTNIQAAIGLGQLEKIEWHLNRRREVANLYYEHLNDLQDFIQLPVEKDWAKHSFWMFSILLKDSIKISRDELMNKLAMDGIETRPIFYPMHVLPPYKQSEKELSVATQISSRGINLPTYALLKEEDVEYICNRIKYHLK